MTALVIRLGPPLSVRVRALDGEGAQVDRLAEGDVDGRDGRVPRVGRDGRDGLGNERGKELSRHDGVGRELRGVAGRIGGRRADELPRGHGRDIPGKGCLAAGIGEHDGRHQERFPLAMSRRVGARIAEELQYVGGEGGSGKRPSDRRNSIGSDRGGQDGEILEQVRAGMAARIVERHTVIAEVDAELGVGEDRVLPDGVAGALVGRACTDGNPVAGVEGDDVGIPARRAADGVIARAPKEDPVAAVAKPATYP